MHNPLHMHISILVSHLGCNYKYHGLFKKDILNIAWGGYDYLNYWCTFDPQLQIWKYEASS